MDMELQQVSHFSEYPRTLTKQELKEQEKQRKLLEKTRKKQEKEEKKRKKQSTQEIEKQKLIEHQQQQIWKEQYEKELPDWIERKITPAPGSNPDEHWMTDKLRRIYQSLKEDFNDTSIMTVSSKSGLQREAVIKMLASHYSEIIQKQIIEIVHREDIHGSEIREILKWEKECSEEVSRIMNELWKDCDHAPPCIVLMSTEVRSDLIDTYIPFATDEIRRLIETCTNKICFKDMKKQILHEERRQLHIPADVMDICDEHIKDAERVNTIVHRKIYLLLYDEISKVLRFFTDEIKKLLLLGDSKYHSDNSLHYVTYTVDQMNNFPVFHERISRITKERTGIEAHVEIHKDFQDLLHEVRLYADICYSTFFKHVVFDLMEPHLTSMTKYWFRNTTDQLPVNILCDHVHQVYSKINIDFFCQCWKRNVCQDILRRTVSIAKKRNFQCPKQNNSEVRALVADNMWLDVRHIVRAMKNTADTSRGIKDDGEDRDRLNPIFDNAIALIKCTGLPEDDISIQTALMINLSEITLENQLKNINNILFIRGDVNFLTRRQLLSGYKPS